MSVTKGSVWKGVKLAVIQLLCKVSGKYILLVVWKLSKLLLEIYHLAFLLVNVSAFCKQPKPCYICLIFLRSEECFHFPFTTLELIMRISISDVKKCCVASL